MTDVKSSKEQLYRDAHGLLIRAEYLLTEARKKHEAAMQQVETTDKPRLTGQCDSCHRGWTVIGETGADVIVKAFHCPCGHTTVMD